MFSGEKLLEDLRSDNSLMKTMVDRFGDCLLYTSDAADD